MNAHETANLRQSAVLTIKGAKGNRLVLGIPNNNVRKQYYEYLVELFEEKASMERPEWRP